MRIVIFIGLLFITIPFCIVYYKLIDPKKTSIRCILIIAYLLSAALFLFIVISSYPPTGDNTTPSNTPTIVIENPPSATPLPAITMKPTFSQDIIDTYNAGFVAYTKKDYETAFNLLKTCAELGYSPAQNMVGDCYRLGNGRSVNEEKAFYWYQQSADQKDASGMLWLGYCYHHGIGTEPNYDLAYQYYTAADEGGRFIAGARLEELDRDFGK